jgi:uncharacterized protein YkwD
MRMRTFGPMLLVLGCCFAGWSACDAAGGGTGTSASSNQATDEETGNASPMVHESIAPTMAGLVAYYAMDGDAQDQSVNAIHAENLGAVATPDRFGIVDNALFFDGEDDFLHTQAPLVGERLKTFSISLWFMTTTQSRGTLFLEGRPADGGLLIRIEPGNQRLRCRAKGVFDLTAAAPVNDGLWHHVVLTADGGAALNLWFDGVLQASGPETPYSQEEPLPYNPVFGRLGHVESTSPKDYFAGALDDMAVYDRPLSDEEISTLFTEGPPRPPFSDAGPNISRFGLQIEVDASGSYDIDGEIVSYFWNFDDGTPPVSTIKTSHTFPDFGVYTVTLTVEDNDGLVSLDELEVSVRDPECVTVGCNQVDTWEESWSALEMDMLDEVNIRRAAGATCGDTYYAPVNAVEMNEVMRVASRLHSLDMANQNYFSHDSLDGRQMADRIADAGFQGAWPLGENIQGGSSTAADAVASLMTSPGHCQNIMDPEYGVMGIGYAYDETSRLHHYWTQNFGGGH